MKSISYNTLEKTEWPEEIFIEGGLLSRGDTMLIGAESKGGKSTLLAGLIRQMITGGDFLGFKVTKPLKVFYMQAELREKRLKERLFPTYEKIKEEYKFNLYIWSTQGIVLFNREHKETIESEIINIMPDVLIIDPMLNFHNFNENDSQQMAEFFRELDRLKSTYNMAIIMAHHFRKTNSDPKQKISLLESIRGSSALRGWAVTTIAMEGRGESEYRDLAFELRNSDEPIKRTIHYNARIKDFDWHDPITTVKQWAIEYLESCNGMAPTTEQFISRMLENNHVLSGNRSKAFSMKNTLVGTGIIRVVKSGKTMIVYRA
jgi:AAA domain